MAQRPSAHGIRLIRGLPRGLARLVSSGRVRPRSQPTVDEAVLHAGWFEDTMDPFLAETPGPAAFLHLDADLYS